MDTINTDEGDLKIGRDGMFSARGKRKNSSVDFCIIVNRFFPLCVFFLYFSALLKPSVDHVNHFLSLRIFYFASVRLLC